MESVPASREALLAEGAQRLCSFHWRGCPAPVTHAPRPHLSAEFSLAAIHFSSCKAENMAESWQLLRADRGLVGAKEGPFSISHVSFTSRE